MISISQDVLFIKLRAFILSLIPDVEVIQGLGNRVPMALGGFIAITPGDQERLSTNETTYDVNGNREVKRSTKYGIQIDCYGPDSSDWATTIETMFRDPYGCDMLAPECQPLYCDQPRQSALTNGEENYEQRWVLTAMLQFNPTITVPQEYADVLTATLIEVDATFKEIQ